MRKSFSIDNASNIRSATVRCVCDDDCELYVDGILVASDWNGVAGPVLQADITSLLNAGENVIAIKASDTAGGCRYLCVEAIVVGTSQDSTTSLAAASPAPSPAPTSQPTLLLTRAPRYSTALPTPTTSSVTKREEVAAEEGKCSLKRSESAQCTVLINFSSRAVLAYRSVSRSASTVLDVTRKVVKVVLNEQDVQFQVALTGVVLTGCCVSGPPAPS